ncbi:MAG: pyridine nucleotide-disulfide oxidoreductase [Deltaproteobacteria bacterium RIFOXYD12_FULL_50_9]|nr:MAG: pyridine nucleotide-disulfide oxidoreductase [Deltaproteobacteria bacterium RIFOXYD12_FULL_50_9]
MTQYLIIGNGVAGTTAAESLRKQDPTGSITMITEENLPFYYRIRLPDFLAGIINEEQLLAQKTAWYDEQRITLITASRVISADPEAKNVTTDSAGIIPYDRLLIATGSHSFVPPISGSDKKGVFTLRDISDARAIKAYAAQVRRVVIIGGGLLGLETGQALRKLDKEVTIVEFFSHLLPRQLDAEGGARLKQIMETGMGFSFKLASSTKEIAGKESANGVVLEGGETLPCEMVIISAGVRASLDLALNLELSYDKGIKVNERLETSRPDIFAAGDVAEFGGRPPYGIWPAAMQQGKIAGITMAGGSAVYSGTTMANKLKVVGIDLAAAGDIDADNHYQTQITATATTYRKIVIDQNRIIGCILLGDTSDFTKLTKAITDRSELHLFDQNPNPSAAAQ